jgi:hypothetical protein
MKEIVSLQRQVAALARTMEARQADIAEQEALVAKGGSSRELRLLREDLADDKARLEGLQRRLADLQRQEATDEAFARLLELDRLLEDASEDRTAARTEAGQEFDSLARSLAGKEAAYTALEVEFLSLARGLARIDSFAPEDRAKAEALRDRLVASGAKLQAIGRTQGRSHAFTIGGGGGHPWPEPWGGLLAQAVTAIQHRRLQGAERAVQAAGVGS